MTDVFDDETPFEEDYDKYDDYNYDRIYTDRVPQYSYKELEELGFLPNDEKRFETTRRLMKYQKDLQKIARNTGGLSE